MNREPEDNRDLENLSEPLCPICTGSMKEFATMFRCRALSCRYEITKKFPPNPKFMEEYVEMLVDMATQYCEITSVATGLPGEPPSWTFLDSMALSTNANVLKKLAEFDKIVIDHENGYRIIAHWKEN